MKNPKPETFYELIASCKNNHSIGFKSKNGEMSYHEFYEYCHKIKGYILHNCQNNNIILFADYSCEWVAMYYAIQLAGKTAILMDASADIEKVKRISNQYHTDIFLCNVSHPELTYSLTFDEIINDSEAIYDDYISKKNESGISTVIFTSGTTEKEPKGVALSEIGLLSSAYCGYVATNVTDQDVMLHLIPFSHAYGLAGEVIVPIIAKLTLCFGESVGYILRDIEQYKVTSIYVVPQILKALLPFLREKRLSSIKKITCGSAELDQGTVETVLSSNIEFHVTYGLSECSPGVATSERLKKFERHYSGEVLPCCSAKIVNDEIVVSGDNLMLGYYNGDVLDKDMLKNGEFHTGDTGFLKNNSLYVTGRIKDILVFGNGIKYIRTDLENKIKNAVNADDCYIFTENDKLNIILYKVNKDDVFKSIISVLPFGVMLDKVYLKTTPILHTKLGKTVNSPELQLKNCKLIPP